MAKCEKGYLCEVCGEEVEEITESDLYLRYVLGEVDPEKLPQLPERHIRCNPAVAQYIIDSRFEPLHCDSMFNKENLDPDFVKLEEARITRAWQRLQEIPSLGIAITEYPLLKPGD